VFFHPQKHIKDDKLTFLFGGLLVFLNPTTLSRKKKLLFRYFFHRCEWKRIVALPVIWERNGVAMTRFDAKHEM
jgi:hypothetical protein